MLSYCDTCTKSQLQTINIQNRFNKSCLHAIQVRFFSNICIDCCAFRSTYPVAVYAYTKPHPIQQAAFSNPARRTTRKVGTKRHHKDNNNLAPVIQGTGIHSLKLTANAPENRPAQKETSIPTIQFLGSMLVSRRVFKRYLPKFTIKIPQTGTECR